MFLFFLNGEKITAMTLANYVLEKALNKNITITNCKLQKILYYIQGFFIATFKRPLFPDEIQAWKFGPVVPNVYYEFSKYGPDELRQLSSSDMSSCSADERDLIDRVIEQKLELSASELVRSTHNETPWKNATDGGKTIRRNTVIPLKDIQDYFQTEIGTTNE